LLAHTPALWFSCRIGRGQFPVRHPHDAVTGCMARMGDKAKPSRIPRRRLCCFECGRHRSPRSIDQIAPRKRAAGAGLIRHPQREAATAGDLARLEIAARPCNVKFKSCSEIFWYHFSFSSSWHCWPLPFCCCWARSSPISGSEREEGNYRARRAYCSRPTSRAKAPATSPRWPRSAAPRRGSAAGRSTSR
jgi:hypothetical protein